MALMLSLCTLAFVPYAGADSRADACLPDSAPIAACSGGGGYNCIGGSQTTYEHHSDYADQYGSSTTCTIHEQDGQVCYGWAEEYYHVDYHDGTYNYSKTEDEVHPGTCVP